MIAKGHDFPNVTLVGVVNTDVGLNIPDYRAGERVLQLLCQAAGRAGRGFRPGHVVLQTYNPEHYVVRAAAGQDYRAFYVEELAYRDENRYPPFTRLVRLIYSNVNEMRAQQEAERVTADLTKRLVDGETQVFGPVPAYLWRLRGHYRWQTTLRGRDPSELLSDYQLPRGWVVDVDPVGIA
jgi:primosomal protein N' (replication factor Y)